MYIARYFIIDHLAGIGALFLLDIRLAVLTLAVMQLITGQAAGKPSSDSRVNRTHRRHEKRHDSIWLVSTRSLSGRCPASATDATPLVWHMQTDWTWKKSSAEGFLKEDGRYPITTIYVHGNRIDRGSAIKRGMTVYRRLISRVPEHQPIRHIIWSWPSTKVRGPLRDARIKAARTTAEGYYLAQWISQIDSDTKLSLIGYSLGPRVITGAVHLLAGGQILAMKLPRVDTVKRREIRVIAIAPAMSNSWLLPGRNHGNVSKGVDRMLLLYNPRDPVLKRYHLISRHYHPHALGYTGFIRRGMPADGIERLRQVNVSRYVGKTHDWRRYVQSAGLMNKIRDYAMWE